MPDEICRTDLCRSVPFTLTRAGTDDDTNDGLTIEGYGAVFDSVTEINSWEGSFEEVIARGAFKKSIRERSPKMQFDHGRHPLLGSVPLGRWDTVTEDTHGLLVSGRLSDNWLIEPFRDAIKDGGVEGMSFRFSVERDDWADKDGKRIRDDDELFQLLFFGAGERGPIRRTLKEVRVSEVGPVVWPAYSDTEVGVRSSSDGRQVVVIDLAKLRDRAPTEMARLSRLVALTDRATAPDDTPEGARSPEAAQAITDEAATDAGPELSDAASTDTAPRSTDQSADEHPEPDSAPPATDRSAGEHAQARPANPTERKALIRAEYRARLDRLLAIPPQDHTAKDHAHG